MDKLYKKKTNFLDADVLCPEKMLKVRKSLQQQLLVPEYDKWKKDDELLIMKDLSIRTLPKEYSDIQLMARKLYTGYMFSKFSKVEGIDKWKKEFDEVLYEEMIE